MKQTTKNHTTLLEIAGEGGSITINKKLFENQYKYWFTTNEAAMADLLSAEDLEGLKLHSKSAIVDSFEEAFAIAKNKYRIFMLHLIYIDDEVKEFVVKDFSEYKEYKDMESNAFGGRSWRVLLGFEPNDRKL